MEWTELIGTYDVLLAQKTNKGKTARLFVQTQVDDFTVQTFFVVKCGTTVKTSRFLNGAVEHFNRLLG